MWLLLVIVLDGVVGDGQRLLLPFVAAGVAATGMVVAREPIDRLVRRLTHHRLTTPYSVLAQTTARVGAGSLEEALPGLAQVLAEGTGAQRAVVWLVVDDRLVESASFPADGLPAAVADNLAVLLARPDTDHVVPVLDGTELRAALAIEKPDAPITPADQRLMQDVADGAGLLLRSVQRGVELHERVRQADELAAQLRESRRRLTRAREVERRRLIGELSHATTERLGALHDALDGAADGLDAAPEPDGRAGRAGAGPRRAGRTAGTVPGDRPRRVPGGAARPGPGRRARRGDRGPAPDGAADRRGPAAAGVGGGVGDLLPRGGGGDAPGRPARAHRAARAPRAPRRTAVGARRRPGARPGLGGHAARGAGGRHRAARGAGRRRRGRRVRGGRHRGGVAAGPARAVRRDRRVGSAGGDPGPSRDGRGVRTGRCTGGPGRRGAGRGRRARRPGGARRCCSW